MIILGTLFKNVHAEKIARDYRLIFFQIERWMLMLALLAKVHHVLRRRKGCSKWYSTHMLHCIGKVDFARVSSLRSVEEEIGTVACSQKQGKKAFGWNFMSLMQSNMPSRFIRSGKCRLVCHIFLSPFMSKGITCVDHAMNDNDNYHLRCRYKPKKWDHERRFLI